MTTLTAQDLDRLAVDAVRADGARAADPADSVRSTR